MSAPRRCMGSVALRVTLAGVLIAASLGGCASGGNMFSSGIDPADTCGREHAAFADSKSFYLQEVAQGALLGAIGGAALGALTAGATGGNAGQGALIGAGVGTVAGGAAGYANAQQKQAADQTALANSVYGEVSRASQEIDRVTTTFGLLRNCRFAAADRVKSAFQQGTLTRDQAAQQLADQRRRFDEEVALARQYGAKMAEQDQRFRMESDSLVKQDPEAQQILASRAERIAYVATAAINLRSGPSDSAERVGSLHKGQVVHVMSDPASGSWRKVVLDDGTSGFAAARFLSPASRVASTGATAPESPKPALETTNRSALVAVAATETIPEKRSAYNKAVDTALAQSNLSFNLDQAGPPA